MNDHKKRLLNDDGKTYFTKESERRFYFVLTIIMLLLGIFTKVGIF